MSAGTTCARRTAAGGGGPGIRCAGHPSEGHGQADRALSARGAPEIATPPYKGYTYYSDLRRILRRIEDKAHRRVDVDFAGKSANGNPLWTVVVTGDMSFKDACANERYRSLLLTDPAKAAAMLNHHSGIRIPVFINCSIHGGETTGMDAGLRLLRRLAFGDDRETKRILKEVIVVIDPCQNPDGRITDLRRERQRVRLQPRLHHADAARDRDPTNTLRTWLPTTMLDLHGYVDPMLIEPTTIPHNPNWEYDLLLSSALPLGRARRPPSKTRPATPGRSPTCGARPRTSRTTSTRAGTTTGLLRAADRAGVRRRGVHPRDVDQDDGRRRQPLRRLLASVKYSIDHKWQMLKNQAEFFRRGVENVPDSVHRPAVGGAT